MSTLSLKDAKAGLSAYVDEAIRGEFATITRHGKPVAVLVPLRGSGDRAQGPEQDRPSLASHLQRFPGSEFERNGSPSRDVGL
ncbi:type II toxin-antitoxin system Phd/YefM family antitoxin [Sinorhizobium meliloti]|jgi:prevent-host-death family protein|uniref:Antitoxin n=1 Tax=Sinorhizobium meliloti (strain SM11) TaxID=707241 RepID=F7XHV1_SINMM|nr:type II toxin-antitoxin system Phd/YefM family antitoxin [Sinorhizobium meliloti]AEH82851.1 Prevent-host-death protein [Sinorhizobium meliloti SM11]AGA10145.1 prevent-host-death family protein [Sinorhizobium meliloti GR4]MCO6421428.1 type II toxin-antitoxin system Phd/YefM family antitoxin [Sinorhizobium meliloti]MDE3761338.1 type II toxin-antitoxin system Phd/YefM family antitoxin [Sinorhizobium meliloti]MDE4561627.1 type II toxin-antitoxin system Phd/YefM family antitoxin [Sinorhizobium m